MAGLYTSITHQHVEKEYMRKVPEAEKLPAKAWYLPDFPVLRPDRPTTNMRMVFNASARSDGVSLYHEIYQGPKLQKDLFNILVRFRQNPVALI